MTRLPILALSLAILTGPAAALSLPDGMLAKVMSATLDSEPFAPAPLPAVGGYIGGALDAVAEAQTPRRLPPAARSLMGGALTARDGQASPLCAFLPDQPGCAVAKN